MRSTQAQARGPFRRELTWPLLAGAVALACGTSSDLNVPQRLTAGGAGGKHAGPAGAGGLSMHIYSQPPRGSGMGTGGGASVGGHGR
jgi:hypothetical protein